MRIAHFSDMHLRGRARFDEHRVVIEQLVKDVRSDSVDHVLVTGDIFHTKTQGITPEYIDFMCWWMPLVADVAPLHVILGNHDAALTNASRQDAVSPIVNALKHPRVHLYKYSGVYGFAPRYNWCVFSIYDTDQWERVRPVPDEINIACYHGPVIGAVTETDWEVTSGLTVDFFKDFDFVMLGDIHATQYLGYRDVELEIDEKDLVDYPNAEVLST